MEQDQVSPVQLKDKEKEDLAQEHLLGHKMAVAEGKYKGRMLNILLPMNST